MLTPRPEDEAYKKALMAAQRDLHLSDLSNPKKVDQAVIQDRIDEVLRRIREEDNAFEGTPSQETD